MSPQRRAWLGLLGVAPAWALGARSSPSGVPLRRIGVLAPSTAEREALTLEPFFAEMRTLGWIEGRTVVYDRAFGDDRPATLAQAATALVERRPELIYAPPAPAAVAARKATATIPIVFGTGTDPVATGLVASLSKPGGNVTGVLSVIDSLAPKLVELMAVMLPLARRIGLLSDPADPRSAVDLRALHPVADERGLTLVQGHATSAANFDAAVATLLAQRVHAIITGTALTFNLRSRLLELANAGRVPVIGHRAELADAGALFAYGASLAAQLRRSAHLVDKVLRGGRPADIPVEQPTVFELVVNLKTARAFGITVPTAVLVRADRVIE